MEGGLACLLTCLVFLDLICFTYMQFIALHCMPCVHFLVVNRFFVLLVVVEMVVVVVVVLL